MHVKNHRIKRHCISAITCISLLFIGCTACSQHKKDKSYTAPQAYALHDGEVIKLPSALEEISGLALLNGRSDTIYAQQDENAKLYSFVLNDPQLQTTTFGKNGDYEDIAIGKGYVIILRSDGQFFSFPLADRQQDQTTNVTTSKKILPKGEYESLAFGTTDSVLYVLCKTCKEDKTQNKTLGYRLSLQADGSVQLLSTFGVDNTVVKQQNRVGKGLFKPSAIAQHPLSKEWYILSSVNKVLVVADSNWHIHSVYHLDPKIYTQPEGLTFDRQNTLYISNEAGPAGGKASIVRIPYQNK